MAGIYTPEQLGIKPPKGGFKQGGWYQGRQYWNGTFSDPGVIHPQSNQIGAGKEVSREVVQQTNPANWDYLQKLKQQPQPKPIATYNPPPSTPTPSSPSIPSSSAFSILGQQQTPTIDLKGLYDKLYKDLGIEQLENDLKSKTQAYNQAVSKINDNPFLSEANRVGRIQKLTTDFQNAIAPIRDEIAKKKADIETQLKIQLKQFDINSQQARDAREQLNFLLQSGMLDGATGEDIANITRMTGISSSMIESAIKLNKAKNLKTVVKEFDDGTNQGFYVVNVDTGEIISKQVVAKSKGSGTGGLTTTQQRNITGNAREIIRVIDEQYRTINGKLQKLDKEDWSGDKRLSAQEYLLAVNRLMEKTGLDKNTAAAYITQAMKDLGYSSWKPK